MCNMFVEQPGEWPQGLWFDYTAMSIVVRKKLYREFKSDTLRCLVSSHSWPHQVYHFMCHIVSTYVIICDVIYHRHCLNVASEWEYSLWYLLVPKHIVVYCHLYQLNHNFGLKGPFMKSMALWNRWPYENVQSIISVPSMVTRVLKSTFIIDTMAPADWEVYRKGNP